MSVFMLMVEPRFKIKIISKIIIRQKFVKIFKNSDFANMEIDVNISTYIKLSFIKMYSK